ncbi:helix-turn-helix domain-containing protein [Achromobacter xylosoxidans]
MSSATPASASNTADNGVAGTAAFSKFMRVLQWVADNPEPVGIAEIAKATGFPRPTVHRIVAALTAERLLVEIGATRSWTLGHRLVQLASRSWSRSGLRTVRATPCARCATKPAKPCIWPCPRACAWSISRNWKAPARCRWPRASAPACACIPPPWARPTWRRWRPTR